MHHTAERTHARTQVALGEPDPTDPELFDASRTVYEARLPRSAFAQAVTVARAHACGRCVAGTVCARMDRYALPGFA